MIVALTIEDLGEAAAEELRLRAVRHGQSIEAEARDILIRGIHSQDRLVGDVDPPPPAQAEHAFGHLVGSWAGRGTTDKLMRDLRGEE